MRWLPTPRIATRIRFVVEYGEVEVFHSSLTKVTGPVIHNNAPESAGRPFTISYGQRRLTSFLDATGQTAFSYDALGRETAERKPAPKAIAVFADPVFAKNDPRVKPSALALANSRPAQTSAVESRIIEHTPEKAASEPGALRIARLPFTRQEAERIAAFAPRGELRQSLDFAASRAAATSGELSQYRFVHFATHGILDAERPELSALVLSLVDERGQTQDGFLRAHEIYNLNLPAELVVLSACETGLGKQVKGEGLVGLTRGFMYAGAPRVVVSLWNVNDQATSELMARFYRKMLKGNQRPAAALRMAQVDMWRQRQWRAPYYWATFVLQGEWK